MRQIALAVTHLLLDNEIIDTEEEEVYAYGLQLVLTSGTTSMVIIGMGLIIHQLFLTLLFVAALMGLRHYTGGFHAHSYLNCFCISCLCYMGMLGTVYVGERFLPQVLALLGSWLIHI